MPTAYLLPDTATEAEKKRARAAALADIRHRREQAAIMAAKAREAEKGCTAGYAPRRLRSGVPRHACRRAAHRRTRDPDVATGHRHRLSRVRSIRTRRFPRLRGCRQLLPGHPVNARKTTIFLAAFCRVVLAPLWA